MNKVDKYLEDVKKYQETLSSIKEPEPLRLEIENKLFKAEPDVFRIDKFGQLDILAPRKIISMSSDKAIEVAKWILDMYSEG